MTRTTTIRCDACGESHSAANHAGLWERLHRAGWAKGPRIEGITTHFCLRDSCRNVLRGLVARTFVTGRAAGTRRRAC